MLKIIYYPSVTTGTNEHGAGHVCLLEKLPLSTLLQSECTHAPAGTIQDCVYVLVSSSDFELHVGIFSVYVDTAVFYTIHICCMYIHTAL